MPEQKTIKRARRDKHQGKSANTRANSFARKFIISGKGNTAPNRLSRQSRLAFPRLAEREWTYRRLRKAKHLKRHVRAPPRPISMDSKNQVQKGYRTNDRVLSTRHSNARARPLHRIGPCRGKRIRPPRNGRQKNVRPPPKKPFELRGLLAWSKRLERPRGHARLQLPEAQALDRGDDLWRCDSYARGATSRLLRRD